MSTMVSSTTEKPVAGVLAAIAIGLGAASMVFYALNRIALRYPPGSDGLSALSNSFFAMFPIQAWVIGGLITLLGVALAVASIFIRRTNVGLAVFALGACCSSIIFGLILAI
ncbi:hypothetical protein [Luethyella okanaganae]|uniref:Uncharacterized protein n=1 Tax=Luethyella okanaganae TaxID=69372 RepID=A0ABW1VF06_9MICO